MKYFIAAIIFLSFSCKIFGNIDEKINHALNYCQNDWLAAQIDNRSYFKKDAILITDTNIYLIAGELYIPLPTLKSDFQGLFSTQKILGWWRCNTRNCGYWNPPEATCCQNCLSFKPNFD